MGVLDTFVFLLETDNKNALQGMKEAEQGENAVADGANHAHKEMLGMFSGIAEKAGITTGSLKELAIATLGIAGAGLSLNAVLDHTAEMLAKVRAAETVGIGIGQYDALSRTFQALGVDADAFRDSMIDLNESLGEGASDAKSGKAQAFKALGVSLKDNQGNIKSADEALLELSDTMSKMDKQQAIFQIKQLGITDNAVITAMLKGRSELERQIKFQKELGVLSDQDAKKLERFGMAQNELSAIFTRFADVLAVTVVPALDLLIDTTVALISWVQAHKGILVAVLGALAFVAIPAMTSALWSMAAAAWAAITPFLPLIAAVVGLALVIDDLWNYFNGGESVIGDLVNKFPELGAVLESIKESVMGAWEALKLLFSNPGAFMDAFIAELKASWDDIITMTTDAANKVWEAVTKAWDKLATSTKQVFTNLLAWITNIFSNIGNYISDSVSFAASNVISKAKSLIGLGEDESPPQAAAAAPAVAANTALNGAARAPAIPANPAAVSRGGQTTVQNNQHIDKINITTGSGDPNEIRGAVTDGMNDHAQQLAAQYDDGRSH